MSTEKQKKYYLKNKEKRLAYDKKYKKDHPESKEKRRIRRFRYELIITKEEYDDLLKIQNNVCAICKKVDSKKSLAIDHNHKTGKIRGLLCEGCNIGLGGFKDDILLLSQSIKYLKKDRN